MGRVLSILVIALVVGACGDDQPTSGQTTDLGVDNGVLDGGPDDVNNDVADATQDTTTDASNDVAADPNVDIDTPDTPLVELNDRYPCDDGSADCWTPDRTVPRCSTAQFPEDFSTGNYNVHRYQMRIDGEADVLLSLRRLTGQWAPALFVTDGVGRTLSDGEDGLVEGGGIVTVDADGRMGNSADVTIRLPADQIVHVYLTSWEVIDSGFSTRIPTDATYELSVESVCDNPPVECVVNGVDVPERACVWLEYIGREVVPALQGSRDERLTTAARVAWWALKEGVLFLDNPIAYSNCNFPTGDEHIGPLETCVPGRAWQVGLSGVQVPAATLDRAEDLAGELYPGQTSDEVLRDTAILGALTGGDVDTVVASTGDLRRSWLLRNPAIGFTVQVAPVTRECIDDTRSWCYGTGWDATRWFAPDRTGAFQSIDDLYGLFDQLAP